MKNIITIVIATALLITASSVFAKKPKSNPQHANIVLTDADGKYIGDAQTLIKPSLVLGIRDTPPGVFIYFEVDGKLYSEYIVFSELENGFVSGLLDYDAVGCTGNAFGEEYPSHVTINIGGIRDGILYGDNGPAEIKQIYSQYNPRTDECINFDPPASGLVIPVVPVIDVSIYKTPFQLKLEK